MHCPRPERQWPCPARILVQDDEPKDPVSKHDQYPNYDAPRCAHMELAHSSIVDLDELPVIPIPAGRIVKRELYGGERFGR